MRVARSRMLGEFWELLGDFWELLGKLPEDFQRIPRRFPAIKIRGAFSGNYVRRDEVEERSGEDEQALG